MRREEGDFVLARSAPAPDRAGTQLTLSVVSHPPARGSIERLEHELALREHLDASWSARPVRLACDDERASLELEDPGGELLSGLVGQPWPVAAFLRVAVGLAHTLCRAHERGLIHKDVKPTNVLVDVATGRTWLTGFGIASRLPRERRAAQAPEAMAGTLAYMAPEQTGRMNRSVDARSDLYAYGVTLYEMLTGTLPFTAGGPMEWIHSHIAKQPLPPTTRTKGIPEPIAAIVMKLLAKDAEERYQTAAGAQADLQTCLDAWSARGHVDAFPLGATDVSDRLLVPEKLYGRERDIARLVSELERVVTSGTPGLTLVSGYSGIGKSSVVAELHEALVAPRARFASGKFDPYERHVPYATLAQALQGLVRMLLGLGPAELGEWREALLRAVGPNGELVVSLIPELELVIGKQAPAPELPPLDAQSRFQGVFRRFLAVFATAEHPLALFLDDLQWVDAATLGLLEHLMTEPEVRHLLLIGAYRDNEVGTGHPLLESLARIRRAGGRVHEIVLGPLERDDVERLAADTLHCAREEARPLAALVHEKTGGNPFFAIQFFTALVEESLLAFDGASSRWVWDLARIRAKGFTDNVVDLMAGKLGRLPGPTQEVLSYLACLGSTASRATLALVHGSSEKDLDAALWDAVLAGLVFPRDGSYTFVHDRVQEAAYGLVAERDRAALHLRIGRLFVERTPADEREEKIFEIVNQLDRGSALIDDGEERVRVAELNLVAGKRARMSTAHTSALAYLAAGRALLAGDAWEKHYALTFALELQLATCELLTGELARAEERLDALARRARSVVNTAAVTCLRVDLFTSLRRSDRAVEVCLEYLRRVGIAWSPHPTKEESAREYARIWEHLAGRDIESLVDLPPMTDLDHRATIDVLTSVQPPALFTDENLHGLVVARMTNLSLEHGNTDGSCYAYAVLGVVLGPHFGEWDRAYRFGKLGFDLVEHRGFVRFKARVYMSFGAHVSAWAKHMRTSLAFVRRAFAAAQESGDNTFAAYSSETIVTFLVAAGAPLGDVEHEAESGLVLARKMGFGLVVDIIVGQLRLVRTLRGLTPSFSSFDEPGFDERAFESHLDADGGLAFAACWYWIRKLQARFFAGDHAGAVAASARAEKLLWTSPGHFELAEYHFYGALACAANLGAATVEQRPVLRAKLAAHRQQLATWAEHCPANFTDRLALVEAEAARVDGEVLDAQRLYERALRASREHGFVQNEALAFELASAFYADRGYETIAHTYLQKARHGYERWGADGKVRELEARHPRLREERAPLRSTTTIGAPVEHLDMASVVEVSQAVSGEIVLEKLIDKLLVVALQHAGAERGLLVLPRGDALHIEAEATTGADTVAVRLREAPASAVELPESILRYVVRTLESVILDDATAPNAFSSDPYLVASRGRSVLCVPLVRQARLVGVLYLENKLAPFVFTPARIAVLELLAPQAAISLENARLYTELDSSQAQLRAIVDTIPALAWRARADGTAEFYNQQWLDFTGLTLTQARGWPTAVHPDDLPNLQAFWSGLVASGRAGEFEARLRRRDGAYRWFVFRAQPRLDEAGRVVEWYGTNSDIEDRKIAEDALRRAQTELSHVTRVTTLGELAASIAHEVNQPLTAIVADANASLNWLKSPRPDVGRIRESLDAIVRDSERAGQVLARIRALLGRSSVERGECDLATVIGGVLPLVRHDLVRAGIVLDTSLAEDTPKVLGDPVLLQQVILNLVLNAAEASADVGSARRRIQLRLRPAPREGGPWAHVAVEDAGAGLDGNAGKLFDAFYTTKQDGLGMGLSISRSIIERHGGRLWAEPNEVHGATFHFTVPGLR